MVTAAATKDGDMPVLTLYEEILAYVTLGLLCGSYQLSLLLIPSLAFFSYKAGFSLSSPATIVLILLMLISLVPINHKPWWYFLRLPIWKVWHKYFDYSADLELVAGKLKSGERYLFWEAPHGIWPLGQFLSCPYIEELTGVPMEEKFINGTGAAAIFSFPGVRHVMSWLGTHKVSRKSFTKIFDSGNWAAVVAGGIAEMFLGTSKSEGIFIKKRLGTVKMAIQEGAHIVPSLFFGNSHCFTLVGADGGEGKEGSYMSKLLQRLSRFLKMSILFFYGRHGLAVPFRTRLKMVAGNVVEVKKNSNPTDEEIQVTLDKVIAEFERLYASQKRPAWETRPLKIV